MRDLQLTYLPDDLGAVMDLLPQCYKDVDPAYPRLYLNRWEVIAVTYGKLSGASMLHIPVIPLERGVY